MDLKIVGWTNYDSSFPSVEVANEDVVNAVMAIGRMIVQAIQESDGTPVYIDGQRLTTSQNQRNRMYGKTLQNV